MWVEYTLLVVSFGLSTPLGVIFAKHNVNDVGLYIIFSYVRKGEETYLLSNLPTVSAKRGKDQSML